MKTGFIFVLYKTIKNEVERLEKEISQMGFSDYKIYFIDNTKKNRGYAGGVNFGLKKAMADNCDLLIIANPDISLKGLKEKQVLTGSKYFDIWGLAMKTHEIIYYGGEIDNWRMSGGLISKKSIKRFLEVDFVSGSLMFIKREVINKIGFFDENYFMYYEDVDYCLRAKKAGFRIGIDSDIKYTHFEENSKFNIKKEFYLAKNRLRFLLKYGSEKQKLYELACLPKTLLQYFVKTIEIFSYRNKSFIVNYFSLNISSLAAKFFHFILFLFLVRVFSPAEYGIYNLIWAFIGFFLPFLDLGTTSYSLIYLPKKKEISTLISLRFFISIIIFFFVIIGSFLFFLGQKGIVFFIFLASSVIFANMWSGVYTILNSLNQKLIYSSVVSLIFNFIYSVVIILVLLTTKKLNFLFTAIFFLFVFYALINFFLVKIELKKISLNFNWRSWTKMLKKSLVYVIIGFLAGLYFKQDIFLLKYLKSEVEVGIYSAGYKFLDVFLILAGSYNLISLPVFSQIVNNKQALKNKVVKDCLLLLIFGGTLTFSFYFFAPVLLPMVLKSQYFFSITVIRIVVFALPLILLTSVFFNVLHSLRQSYLIIYILITQIIINFLLNFIFIPKFSYMASAYITLISEVINLLISFVLVFRILNYDNKR